MWQGTGNPSGHWCPLKKAEAARPSVCLVQKAAYLAGWLKVLKADKRAIVVAAAQAEKAADYILGRKEVPVTAE
jgi:antirestriction protein ArdC